jgi:uncharacterized protein (DUF58 family)
MKYPIEKRTESTPRDEAGVYVDRDALIRLQFRSQGFSLLPRQPIHSLLAGRHASRLRGRGLNFEEMRRYLPGDDVRNIDWRVTARTRKPFVRVYTEERDRPTLLLVDQRMSMFFGSVRAMKSVVAAEAAALAAWRVLQAGDRVGALVFDDRDIAEIPPARSRERVMQIIEAIVTKNRGLRVATAPPSNPGQLNAVLERAVRVARHDFLICLISDAAGADADSVRHVTRLSEHNDMLSIFIYDPLESDLPGAGRLIAAQGDLQLEVNSSDAKLQSGFRADFERRLSRIRELSREREIPVLPLSTAEETAAQLRALLGQKAMLRRR